MNNLRMTTIILVTLFTFPLQADDALIDSKVIHKEKKMLSSVDKTADQNKNKESVIESSQQDQMLSICAKILEGEGYKMCFEGNRNKLLQPKLLQHILSYCCPIESLL